MAAAGKSPATGDFSRGYQYSFRSYIITQPCCLAAGGLPGRSIDCPASQRQPGPPGSHNGPSGRRQHLVSLYVGLVAGGAETVRELTGYFLGYSGRGVVGEGRASQRLRAWMRRRGWLLLFLLAFIPNPVLDLAGVTAGALRYPLERFLAVVLAGKTLKFVSFAYACAFSADWLVRYFPVGQ